VGLECDCCGAEVTPQTYLYVVGDREGYVPLGCPACLTPSEYVNRRELLQWAVRMGHAVVREDGGGYTIQDRRN
jgi:hypothetical protein